MSGYVFGYNFNTSAAEWGMGMVSKTYRLTIKILEEPHVHNLHELYILRVGMTGISRIRAA